MYIARIFLAALTMMCLADAVAAYGQASPEVVGGGQSIWLGGEYSDVRAGFPYGSDLRLSGPGIVGTFNWNYHIGLESEARFLTFNSYHGETEKNFLAGPRYTFLHSYKWRPYATFQIGMVKLDYPFSIGSCSCFAMVPGVGLEYRMSHRWSLRAGYQYQILPDSPNFTDEAHYGIRPNGLQIGISYRLGDRNK